MRVELVVELRGLHRFRNGNALGNLYRICVYRRRLHLLGNERTALAHIHIDLRLTMVNSPEWKTAAVKEIPLEIAAQWQYAYGDIAPLSKRTCGSTHCQGLCPTPP